MEIPEQFKSAKWRIMELPENFAALTAHRQHIVLGVNAVSRAIKDMACVVIFADAGNLVSQLPALCVLNGVSCAAIERPTPELLAGLQIRRVACIGVKRSAREIPEFSEVLLRIQRNLVVEDVAYGNQDVAKAAIKRPAPKATVKPPAVKPAAKAKEGPVENSQLTRIKATAESLGVDFRAICQLENSELSVREVSETLHDLVMFASGTEDLGRFSVRFAAVSVLIEALLSRELPLGVHYPLISELGRRLQPTVSRLLSDQVRKDLVKLHVASWIEKISYVHSDTPWQKLRQDLGSIEETRRINGRVAPDWATLLVRSFKYFWHANQKDSFTVLLFSIVRLLLRQGELITAVSALMEHLAIPGDPSETSALWHHFCKAVFHTLGSEVSADTGRSLFSMVDDACGAFGAAFRKSPADCTAEVTDSINRYFTTATARAIHRALVVYASDVGIRLLQLLIKNASALEFKLHVYAALVSVSLDTHPKLKTHMWRRRIVDCVLHASPEIDGLTNSILAKAEDSEVLATAAEMTNRGSVLRTMDAETVISGCAKFRLPIDGEDDGSRNLAKERMVLAELREVKDELLSEISAGNRLLHEFRKIRQLQIRQEALPVTEIDESKEVSEENIPPPRRASALINRDIHSRATVGSPYDRRRRSIDAMNAAFSKQKFDR